MNVFCINKEEMKLIICTVGVVFTSFIHHKFCILNQRSRAQYIHQSSAKIIRFLKQRYGGYEK